MDERNILYDLEEMEKAVRSFAKELEKAAMAIVSWATKLPIDEIRKYNRRKAYHRRLSERNRINPKRKPKGGR